MAAWTGYSLATPYAGSYQPVTDDTPSTIGHYVLDKIVENGLVSVAHHDDNGTVFVWSSASAELIEAAIHDWQTKNP